MALAAVRGEHEQDDPLSPTDLSIAQKVFRARESLKSLSSVFPTDYRALASVPKGLKHFDERPFVKKLQRA